MANTVLNSGGDWSLDASWDGSVAADGDTAMISNLLNEDITQSLDEGDVDCEVIHISRGYSGLFGTSVTPMANGSNILKFYGSSGAWFNLDDGGVANTCTQAWINMPNSQVPVVLGGASGAQAGSTYQQIKIARAAFTLASTALLAANAELHIGRQATAHLAINGPTVPTLKQYGGVVQSNVVLTAADICGGILIQDKAAITEAWVGPGAVLDIRHIGTVATTLHIAAGGTLILDGNENVKTITTLYAEAGAILQYNDLLVVFTNGPYIERI